MGETIDLAVIGGSGFYEMPGLESVESVDLVTPYGPPSDIIRVGRLGDRRVAFLARHGAGHRYLPSELPQRANFWALKSLGVERVIAISAVGSLRRDYAPGSFVVPDQLVDRTAGLRPSTFFGDGVIAHVAMTHPFCPEMRVAGASALARAGGRVHDGGTYVTIEGPAFGTKAESHLFRSWGLSIVGMTAIPEARLAREAELCYAILAAVTDYDAWHEGDETVDAATVFETMARNTAKTQEAVRALAGALPLAGACECRNALDAALVTPPEAISPARLDALRPLLARRLGVME